MTPASDVRPPLVTGRFLADEGEIVLGEDTAAAIDAHIGDRVVLDGGDAPHELTVVGTAVLPTIGKMHVARTSLGRGAIVVPTLVPGSDLDIFGEPIGGQPGPNALFVRYRDGVDTDPATDRLRTATAPLKGFAGLDVLGVQRPATIVTSSDVGAAPALLTIALVVGAAISLLIALGTSVRAHRQDLGVLTALGFTARQRAATVLWQSSAVVVIGVVVGVPGGTLAGRALWRAFTRHIGVTAAPVEPWLVGLLVVVIALLLANALALGPARNARRLHAVETLRHQ
jgi:hypothetical protein